MTAALLTNTTALQVLSMSSKVETPPDFWGKKEFHPPPPRRSGSLLFQALPFDVVSN